MAVDPDAVRALVGLKLRIRELADEAQRQQEQIIVTAWRGGARPASIARALAAITQDLGLEPDQVRGLGMTESTVHSVLRAHRRAPKTTEG